MRNNRPDRVVAAKTADASRRDEGLLVVCGALALALVALAGRIVATW